MKQPALARKSSRSSASSKVPARAPTQAAGRLVVCVRNEGCEASLELRKIYRVVDDTVAESHRLLRVIDESGEDYLYPRANFLPVVLPLAIRRAVLATS